LYEALVARCRALGDAALLEEVLSTGLSAVFGRPSLAMRSLDMARELSSLSRRAGSLDHLGTSGFFLCLLGLRTGNPSDVAQGLSDYRIAAGSGHPWFEF
jgi:hypothetical protein